MVRMWKLYQEKTYGSECRGRRPNQAIQNCLGKLGDLILNIFLTHFLKIALSLEKLTCHLQGD